MLGTSIHLAVSRQHMHCYQLPLSPGVTSSPSGWTEFFQTSSQRETFFPEFCQRFGHRRGKVTDSETKRICHRHRIIIMAGQGWGEQKEHDTEGEKDTGRIMDKYTRLLFSPESFGGCFIV